MENFEIKFGDHAMSIPIPGNTADRVARLEAQVADLQRAIGVDPLPEPEPTPSGIVLSPDDSIQTAIKDAKNGESISLRAGVYCQQLFFDASRRGLLILPYPGDEGKVKIDGRVSLRVNWRLSSGVHSADYSGYPNLWTRVDGHPQSTGRNKTCRPELVTHEDEPLLPVAKHSDLRPGTFYVEGEAHSAKSIHVMLKPGQEIENLKIARYPWLIDGELKDVDGKIGAEDIAFQDLIVQGCSNTTKIGMFNVAGPSWRLRRVQLTLSNTINLKVGSRFGGNLRTQAQNLDMSEIRSIDAGQMHIWGSFANSTYQNFEHIRGNWGGFMPNWEAVFKLENSRNFKVLHGKCFDDNGMSIWTDIGNRDGEIGFIKILNAMRQGMLIEHYAHKINCHDIEIDTVRKFGGIADGYGIQSNVTDCRFERISIKNVEKGIRYKKNENNSRDKGSGRNVIVEHTFENVSEREVYVEGANDMSDTFDETTRPS